MTSDVDQVVTPPPTEVPTQTPEVPGPEDQPTHTGSEMEDLPPDGGEAKEVTEVTPSPQP